jgi:hypothetical protein
MILIPMSIVAILLACEFIFTHPSDNRASSGSRTIFSSRSLHSDFYFLSYRLVFDNFRSACHYKSCSSSCAPCLDIEYFSSICVLFDNSPSWLGLDRRDVFTEFDGIGRIDGIRRVFVDFELGNIDKNPIPVAIYLGI